MSSGRADDLLDCWLFLLTTPDTSVGSPTTVSHFGGLDEPTLQFANFLKALRNIAEDSRRPNELSHLVMQQDNREFDGRAPAILGQSRHRQQVALAVVTFAGSHYPIVS